MNNDLHPHWQSTDGEPVPVRARVQEATMETPKSVVTVSRRPAAIVGMLAVLITGAVAFKAVDLETIGQISGQNAVSVRITEAGFVPKTVNVEHGQTITWTNETAVLHALKSDLLCSNTGFCLQTSPLSKNGKGSFTITPDIPAGSYTYASATDASVSGTIDIITTAASNFENLPPPSPNAPAQVPVNPNTSFNPLDGSAAVPVNPYTIGSVKAHPFDDKEDPTTIESVTGLPMQNPPAIQQTKKPLRQPTTGAGVWIVIAVSGAVLWLSAGRALRAFSVVSA